MRKILVSSCLAVLLLGATPFAAAVVINFDDVNTSGGAVTGAAVTAYLLGYGITLNAPTNGQVIFAGTTDGQVNAPSAPNYFGVGGPLSGFTYSFGFGGPITSFSFTTPGLGSTSTMAAWMATAYAGTTQVDQINQNFIHGPGTPQSTWTLSGTGIDRIEFFSNVQFFAGSNLIFDDVTFPSAAAVPAPGTLALLGLSGLLFGLRRKQRAA